jgi:hypothetical protein
MRSDVPGADFASISPNTGFIGVDGLEVGKCLRPSLAGRPGIGGGWTGHRPTIASASDLFGNPGVNLCLDEGLPILSDLDGLGKCLGLGSAFDSPLRKAGSVRNLFRRDKSSLPLHGAPLAA